jgi:hypothetical protein
VKYGVHYGQVFNDGIEVIQCRQPPDHLVTQNPAYLLIQLTVFI